MNTNRPLAVGTYKPTESFRSIKEHIAVMFDDDQILVACMGAKDDDPENVAETLIYAQMFAAAPKMISALRKIAHAKPRDMSHESFVELVQDIAYDALQEATVLKFKEDES